MKCTLTTQVPILRVEVFAEMAWLTDRPDLALLCEAARRHGDLTPPIIQSVLKGLPESSCHHLIRWLEDLDLCAPAEGGRRRLTALGQQAAETQRVFTKERGLYALFVADHPLLAGQILSVERLPIQEDLRGPVRPLKQALLRDVPMRSIFNPAEQFMLCGLPVNHGEPGARDGEIVAHAQLTWQVDFGREPGPWQLTQWVEVAGGGQRRDIQHEGGHRSLGVGSVLITQWLEKLPSLGRWDAQQGYLEVSFEQLSEVERIHMHKALRIPTVSVPGAGDFDLASFEQIPIGPDSPEAAQRWAMALFEHHLFSPARYDSRAKLWERCIALIEQTPLRHFEIELPAHQTLLDRYEREHPQIYQALAAAVDLSPTALSEALLDALWMGDAEASTSTEEVSERIVRFARGSGWTMRALVQSLLAQWAPRRLLLCDRYVSGHENLIAFRLFIEAIRALSPQTRIDIWTDEPSEGWVENAQRIAKLIGQPPQKYEKIFGARSKDKLHDRYLIVQPAVGEGFGWQMSNSPLHARAARAGDGIEKPLRWKDFLAIRFKAEELEPQFRQWLEEAR